MKNHLLAALLCAFTLVTVTQKSTAEMTLGLQLGAPTGITFRIDNFPVITVGGFDGDNFALSLDGWVVMDKLPTNNVPLYWYLGIGGIGGSWYNYSYWWSDKHHYYYYGERAFFLGLRIPIGLRIPYRHKVEFGAELAPTFYVTPSFGGDLTGGFYIRFFI